MHNPQLKVHNQKGYTLVELLLFMGLFSFFLLLLTDVFSSILETQQRSLSTSYVEQTGRFVLARLLYDVAQASDVTTPATLGSQSSSIVLQVSGSPHTYEVSNSNLTLTDSTGTYLLNNELVSIASFSAQRVGNVGGKPTLKISFDVVSNIQDTTGIQSRNFSTTVGIR